jgi:hypothetical protein
MDKKKLEKNLNYFVCEYCDFKCKQKIDWERHILRPKHHNNIKNDKNDKKKLEKNLIIEFICNVCNKTFKYQSGLSRHKKKCIVGNCNANIESNNNKNIENILEINDLKQVIKDLMKQNNELVKTITDITPKIGNTVTNTNCNNKTFNLQLFLNETCKNAMNLNQFVNNIDITMDDLKNTRINGLVEGVSDIIIRGLKQLEVHERPIHCTDLKRDTLYIKDNEKWKKDENNEIFKETIEEIIEKEQEALNMWTDAHPDWDKVTHLQDEYVLMVNRLYQPVMEDEKKEKKIIHNISKEVYIQK